MHLIVYTSEYTGDEMQADVKQIVAASRRNNAQAGVTGVMFSHDSRFLQFIEGAEADIRQLMSRIQLDPRHSNIQMLFDEPIPERGFGSWNMDHFEIQSGSHLELKSLELISEACRANFQTRTDTIVGIFKGFVASEVP